MRIKLLKYLYPAVSEYKADGESFNPIYVLEQISQLANSPCQYVTDVGQHQMWAAQSFILGLVIDS